MEFVGSFEAMKFWGKFCWDCYQQFSPLQAKKIVQFWGLSKFDFSTKSSTVLT